jgi:hypothetical protein
MVCRYAASRPFPIFSAAAPLAPADPMLPGSLFACDRIEDPEPSVVRGNERYRLPQGRAARGVQNCAGRKGSFRRPKGDCVMGLAEFLMVDPKVLILISAFLVALAAFGVSNRIGR